MICHLLRKKLNSNFPTILKVATILNFFSEIFPKHLIQSKTKCQGGSVWLEREYQGQFSHSTWELFLCFARVEYHLSPTSSIILLSCLTEHCSNINGGSARHKNALRLCQCIVPPIRGMIHALSSSTPHWYSVWVDWWDATPTNPRK